MRETIKLKSPNLIRGKRTVSVERHFLVVFTTRFSLNEQRLTPVYKLTFFSLRQDIWCVHSQWKLNACVPVLIMGPYPWKAVYKCFRWWWQETWGAWPWATSSTSEPQWTTLSTQTRINSLFPTSRSLGTLCLKSLLQCRCGGQYERFGQVEKAEEELQGQTPDPIPTVWNRGYQESSLGSHAIYVSKC